MIFLYKKKKEQRVGKLSNLDVSYDSEIKNNKKCMAALILGIFSMITSLFGLGVIVGIIGLIFGLLGLKDVNQSNQIGKGKAIAGIICSLIGILLTVMFSIMVGNALVN